VTRTRITAWGPVTAGVGSDSAACGTASVPCVSDACRRRNLSILRAHRLVGTPSLIQTYCTDLTTLPPRGNHALQDHPSMSRLPRTDQGAGPVVRPVAQLPRLQHPIPRSPATAAGPRPFARDRRIGAAAKNGPALRPPGTPRRERAIGPFIERAVQQDTTTARSVQQHCQLRTSEEGRCTNVADSSSLLGQGAPRELQAEDSGTDV
jgi:hypothetical protein